MQHPRISAIEALAEDRVLWSLTCATGLKSLAAAAEQAASDRRARRHAAATDYSSWTCLHSLWQNLCFGLRSPQSSPCPLMTVQQTITSVQRHRRNRQTTTSKQASMFLVQWPFGRVSRPPLQLLDGHSACLWRNIRIFYMLRTVLNRWAKPRLSNILTFIHYEGSWQLQKTHRNGQADRQKKIYTCMSTVVNNVQIQQK